MLYQPPVANAEHRNDTHTPTGKTEPDNHPQTSPILRDSHCEPDDRDCHTHTTSQDHCAQDGRDPIGACCAPGPDIATVWAYPKPVYTHTAGDAQTTHTHTHTQPRPS